METGLSELKELFELKDRDLRTYSPLTLAYIGDGVYELVIRTILVKKGNCPVNQLHKKASSLVKAGAQSKMMELLILQKKNWLSIKEAEMHIPLQWPSMLQWQITAGLQALRH